LRSEENQKRSEEWDRITGLEQDYRIGTGLSLRSEENSEEVGRVG